MSKTYTINMIQDEMTAAGSHWWDTETMRHFGCRIGSKVYQGECGIYFVSSEKHADAPRRYSVRKYLPSTKVIKTIGDFNSMTRAAAHKEAAHRAGPTATVTQEAHQGRTEAEQLALDIQNNGGKCTTPTAAHLIRLATKYDRMMTRWCNGEVEPFDADGDPKPATKSLETAITQAAERCGCGAKLGGDPRGCVVKLIMPNKETNDFGKEGWCVPVRS